MGVNPGLLFTGFFYGDGIFLTSSLVFAYFVHVEPM